MLHTSTPYNHNPPSVRARGDVHKATLAEGGLLCAPNVHPNAHTYTQPTLPLPLPAHWPAYNVYPRAGTHQEPEDRVATAVDAPDCPTALRRSPDSNTRTDNASTPVPRPAASAGVTPATVRSRVELSTQTPDRVAGAGNGGVNASRARTAASVATGTRVTFWLNT